eukprot:496796-Pelagomonas_calceolata.AAC.12
MRTLLSQEHHYMSIASGVCTPVEVEHDDCRNEGLAHAGGQAHQGVAEQRFLHHRELVVPDGHLGGVDPVPGNQKVTA